jgi:hypothetical protein
VATSSLLLLPFMAAALPSGRAIGLVTYDAARLTSRHLAAAGAPAAEGRIATVGIVRAETGRPVLDFVTLADLVMAAAPRGRPGRE